MRALDAAYARGQRARCATIRPHPALWCRALQALPPEDISFVPLKQTQEFNARDLLQVGSRAWGVGGEQRKR